MSAITLPLKIIGACSFAYLSFGWLLVPPSVLFGGL